MLVRHLIYTYINTVFSIVYFINFPYQSSEKISDNNQETADSPDIPF